MAEDLTPLGSVDQHADTLGSQGEPVTLRSVSKTFDDLLAVDDIDLTVESGELLVLLGPSGCGKTTTLRMIAGLEVVDEGTITIGDEDVTQALPQERNVSMVFQNYALYPHMTVRENLLFPLGKTDLSKSDRHDRVDDVAALLEIEDHLGKDPDQLSGGQRQRVALGRTIVREPRVFLMDEPLSNLDAKLRVQTRAELRDLQKRLGTTTVYVTHDQEEALSIADRIVIMNDGDIEQIGSPETVYTNPANEFVAGFLGEPSMNILPVSRGEEVRLGETIPLTGSAITMPDHTARLGIRPEDIYVATDQGAPKYADDVGTLTDPVSMTIGVVEPLGHEYEATLRRAETRLTFRASDLDATPGDEVSVVFDADRLHYFDSDGGTL